MINFFKNTNLKVKKRQGSSPMVELMFYLIIIIFVTSTAFFFYSEIQRSSKISVMKSEMSSISTACIAYELLNTKGTPPTDLNELLLGLPASDSLDGLDKKFLNNPKNNSSLKSGILDPWGNAYIVDGNARTITSVADKNNDHPETVLKF